MQEAECNSFKLVTVVVRFPRKISNKLDSWAGQGEFTLAMCANWHYRLQTHGNFHMSCGELDESLCGQNPGVWNNTIVSDSFR